MSNFGLVITLAVRNVLRNKRRSLLTGAAIAVALLSANMLAALQAGMVEQLVEDSVQDMTAHVQLHHPEYLDDPAASNHFVAPIAQLEKLKDDGRIETWSQRVRVPSVIRSERESASVTFLGISPQSEKSISFFGIAPISGRFIESEDDQGIVIGARLADYLQTRVGKRVVLATQHTSGKLSERGFRVVGLYRNELESREKAYAVSGIAVGRKMLGYHNEVSEVAVRARSRDRLGSIVDSLKGDDGLYTVKTWRELEPLLLGLMKVQDGFLWLWYFIVTLTVVFGLVNTLFMAILERVREFGLFQALGMPSSMIRMQVLLESVVLLIFGVIVGNILSLMILWALRDGIDLSAFVEAADMFGLRSIIVPVLTARDVVIANGAVLIIGILGSLYPAWRASRLNPTKSLMKV